MGRGIASGRKDHSTDHNARPPQPHDKQPQREQPHDKQPHDNRKALAMVTAIVLIDVEADRITEAAQQIADLPGVDQVYSCAGDVDLVAITRVADHEAIAELVPGHISKVEGVLRTVTHIAFRSYSQRDSDDAFSIGMQS